MENGYKKLYDNIFEQIQNLLMKELELEMKELETNTILSDFTDVKVSPIKFPFKSRFESKINDLLELAVFVKDKMNKENTIYFQILP